MPDAPGRRSSDPRRSQECISSGERMHRGITIKQQLIGDQRRDGQGFVRRHKSAGMRMRRPVVVGHSLEGGAIIATLLVSNRDLQGPFMFIVIMMRMGRFRSGQLRVS